MKPLSPTQCRLVCALIAGNTTTKTLARAANMQPGTVRSHMAKIFEKADVQDKTQLVLWALRNGWTLDGPARPAISQIPDMLRYLAKEMETVLK